ncbi:flagellar export protein FliJ [Campylobacter sp. US33a]|uniref:flagellar export protein FliJ n=1 Tax=Campylobacter sp. US33a TaxID=2498120 RepID=UPI0010680AB3|nr:flagellar export protein FliJ [Campylobacter sp. US33a]TEY04494.1 hypothetical protein ELQ16_00255 [Campylobacter sp. US33a]
MKTKYETVLKVKKRQLDNAENNLNKARARQMEHEKAYVLAKQECEQFSLPKSGSIELLKSNLTIIDIARSVKNEALRKVELSKKEMVHYQHLYKKAHLDYEKMKYLQSEELKKIQIQLKKSEEKFIDELAVSRYFMEKIND